MTKRFALTPELTCPELDGYKLPEMPNKVEFTIDDMEQAFRSGFNITGETFNHEWLNYPDVAKEYENEVNDFIASLRTPRIPIAIEVEMECGRCFMPLSQDECWSAKECSQGSLGYPDKPATHPDGTVKGVWVYE